MVSPATDTFERVGVAEGDEPAAAVEATEAPRSLKQRLAAIRDECAGITKDDIKMGNFTIKGHTFEGVLSEVRPLLARHGVDITPNLETVTYSGNRCDVLIAFTFERTDDSDEQRTIRWGGAGTDNGDKAFAKAGTNCVKEMLKKRFLISDREDAKEAEESVEHKPDSGATRGEVEAAKERAADSIVGWAQTFKVALEGCKTAKEVGRLQADNAQRLASPELPQITKTFFVELIERLKRDLPKEAAK